jgi:hypothetical protein
MYNLTFIDRAKLGEFSDPSLAIDDFIDEWHDSDSILPLHEYLGLTWDQYSQWIKKSSLFNQFNSR